MAKDEVSKPEASLSRPSADVGTPAPLRELLDRMHRTLDELAGDVTGREELHALRNQLSDICILTETSPKIRRAVNRVVTASDRLCATAMDSRQGKSRASKPTRLDAAAQALDTLNQALASARPSRIALDLDRGW